MTPTYLKERFTYNFWTGECFWNERPRHHFKNDRLCNSWNVRFAGKVAGSLTSKGYVGIRLNKRTWRAHRLIWLYMTGIYPVNIDHADGNPSNNKWNNLRPATKPENCANCKLRFDNSSGVKGVDFKNGKWRARVTQNYKQHIVGMFNTIEEAEVAIKDYRATLHGEFANHG